MLRDSRGLKFTLLVELKKKTAGIVKNLRHDQDQIRELKATEIKRHKELLFDIEFVVSASRRSTRGHLLFQFLRRDRGSADDADDDPCGKIGKPGRVSRACACGHCEGERADDRVPCSGNVKHILDRKSVV